MTFKGTRKLRKTFFSSLDSGYLQFPSEVLLQSNHIRSKFSLTIL